MTRTEAIKRSLTTLRFFHDGPQGVGLNAIGYRGFYYHFLDMETGERVWNCEISTIDTTYLLAGALAASMYFDRQTKQESEIRRLAEELYARADWHWAQNGGLTVTHGWKPETGFIRYRWTGYSEALILYILGLASPTFPFPTTVTPKQPGLTNGRSFMDTSFYMPGRSSFINFHTCGLISVPFRMST